MQSVRPQWLDQVATITHTDGRKIATGVPGLDNLIRPSSASSGNLTPPAKRRQVSPIAALNSIVVIPPGEGETCQITGKLREIDRKVNHMKAFGYDDDGPMAIAMAKAILGDRWVREFGRITVHAPRLDSTQLESYTAYVPAALIKVGSIKRGITVSVKLTSVDVSDRYCDWYCDSFQVVA